MLTLIKIFFFFTFCVTILKNKRICVMWVQKINIFKQGWYNFGFYFHYLFITILYFIFTWINFHIIFFLLSKYKFNNFVVIHHNRDYHRAKRGSPDVYQVAHSTFLIIIISNNVSITRNMDISIQKNNMDWKWKIIRK